MRNFRNNYNEDGKEKRRAAREAAGNKCIRCGSPSVPGKILTTHHFDGDKANDEWWNLMALCQVCHLKVQAKVDPETPFFLEHSEWAKPYVAGFYARKYEGRLISREEAIARMGELLAYELAGASNSANVPSHLSRSGDQALKPASPATGAVGQNPSATG